jgi:rod shape-determining protein MreD
MGKKTRRIHYTSSGTGRRFLTEQIRLILVLALTGGMLIALETTVCARIPLPFFGWSPAAPALGLLFAMAVGFHYGEREGGMTGLLCGWLSDAASASAGYHLGGMMILPLLYFLCGYLSGTVGRRRLAHNLPSFIVFSVFGGGFKCLYAWGVAALELRAPPPWSWVWRGLAPAWALTVLGAAVVYGIVWGERRLMEPK